MRMEGEPIVPGDIIIEKVARIIHTDHHLLGITNPRLYRDPLNLLGVMTEKPVPFG